MGEKLIPDGGDYSKMPKAQYGHDAFGNPVVPEAGHVLVAEGDRIANGDKPFDVYAGWMESDGYDAEMSHHASSHGRWTAWERKTPPVQLVIAVKEMAKTKEPIPVMNLALASEKKKLMAHIGSLPPGLYDVLIKPRKKVRSLQANRYYFVAVVLPFCEWLRREWGDPSIDSDFAHDVLAAKILGWDERLIEITGEVIKSRKRTKDMEKWDFNNYIEKASAWLAELGIVVIPSELFFEGATEGKHAK